jgi:hypothetical protein
MVCCRKFTRLGILLDFRGIHQKLVDDIWMNDNFWAKLSPVHPPVGRLGFSYEKDSPGIQFINML